MMDTAIATTESTTTTAPVPAQAENLPAESGNEETSQTNGEDVAAKTEKEKADLQKGVQRRIDKITREKYLAEARARALEERLSAIESKQQAPQKPADDSMPKIEQFSSFDDYVQAKAEYAAKRLIESTLTEREKRQAAERAQSERATTQAKWNERLAQATVEIPDFEEVISSSDVPMSPAMQDAIMESDIGTKIAYHLANNPDEARKIAAMSPSSAIRAIGRIEERLEKPAEKKPTSAPAPLTPISGSAKVDKDPADMSQKEFNAWRRKTTAKR